jgi:GntR family transcriptional regulator
VIKHLQVRERLLARIQDMNPDEVLPQERELAETFGVSRTTVRQALQSLIEEGRVYSVRGRGTFVSRGRVSKGLTLTSFSDDMRARDLEPGSRLLTAERRAADPELARTLEIEPGDPVYYVERLRLADGFPMCFERVHLPAAPFPRLLDQRLQGSLYGLLAARYRTVLAGAEQRITATTLGRRHADLLGVPARSPALHVRRRGIDARGRVVELARSLYRADRYDFEMTIHR